ncbi:hypothetical protein [uncultured Campylobacter sp.]|nr:hypothetical protein [uncultured Campylobacter sp.]
MLYFLMSIVPYILIILVCLIYTAFGIMVLYMIQLLIINFYKEDEETNND